MTFEPGCRNNWHIHHSKTGEGSSTEWCEKVTDEALENYLNWKITYETK